MRDSGRRHGVVDHGNWNTWAILRFWVDSGVISTLSNRILPRDGVTMPDMRLRRVVLPQPDGPSSA